MFGNLKIGKAGVLFLTALLFFAASFPLVRARKLASAESYERSARAQEISIRYSSNSSYWKSNGRTFSGWECDYVFIPTDGGSRTGSGACPQWIIDVAKRGAPDLAQVAAATTVYFASDDPAINSLLEFHIASKCSIQDAAPPIGVGMLLLLSVGFVRAMAASERIGRGGVIVDNKGTVIHPEEIKAASPELHSRGNRERGSPVSALELRELYRELVKGIHPDRATDEADRILRERLMKSANAAFERGDAAHLRAILEEYSRTIAG